MRLITKKFTLIGLTIALVLSLLLGVVLITKNDGITNAAEDTTPPQTPNSTTYFYDNLIDAQGNEYALAKKFYKALEKINDQGDFKTGVVDYSISEIVTSDQLKGWIEDGNLEVPKAFSAARDAFLTDHPEIFYINFYKMTISVAKSGGAYVGYINSGREANLFYENGFNTQEKVADAIARFESRIDEIIDIVNKLENKNEYVARDVYLAKEVNIYLASNIKYDYAAYENKDDPNYVAAAYVGNAYGGLVEGKAVCGGFSTAYKVIMNKLGIPCITVNGYSNNKDEYGFNSSASVYHMWNYVWLENPAEESAQAFTAREAAKDGAWYSVDVTWNSASYARTRYAVLNADNDAELHVTDGVISTSGYELKYPELSQLMYGSTGETDGLQFSLTYDPTGKKDDFGNDLVSTFVTVSYNGKSAARLLEEDGLYLVKRESSYKKMADGTMQLVWTNWNSLEYWRQMFILISGGDTDFGDILQDNGKQTRYYENPSVCNIQIAVFDVKPDKATDDSYTGSDPTLGKDPEKDPYYFYYYSNDLVDKSNAVAVSEIKTNESYGTYTPAPYIDFEWDPDFNVKMSLNDSMRDYSVTDTIKMDPNKAFTLTVKYDQPLHVLDKDKPIGISFKAIKPNAHDYAFFVPFEDGSYVKMLDEYTVQFKFCPSLMYEHNDMGYNIFFSNLGSAREVMQKQPDGTFVKGTLDKAPNPAYFNFARNFMACPARFNYDGRLWVDCCAQPTLVSNSDLSENNFKDADGKNLFTETERSQMMLVAEKADTATSDAMLDGIGDIEGSNVTKNDIKSSETYDILLQMCGKYPTIPDGSYVKIALGFPEGYGPNDVGVTFKLYHRKHIKGNEYIIEEIPCVVTQFGIVACVTSFSPYMVAVVDADKATDKTIYASIEGKGGKLTLEDGKIRTIKAGESYTYTIQPDDGYMIYSVTLNGKSVLDKVVNGKLTLGYDDLSANNQLVIQYISNEAATRIKNKLESNTIDQAIEVGKYVVDTKGNVSTSASMPSFDVHPDNFVTVTNNNDSSNAAVIAIAIVSAIVVVAIAVTVAVIVIRRKKQD